MAHLRRADVLWRATLDGVVVRPLGATEVTKLAGSGIALWAALEDPSPPDQVYRRLAASHDTTVEVIAADLAPVIDELIARGVLERVDG